MHRLQPLLADQSGVITRRQVLDLGVAPHEIRRWLRRRELAVLHPGIYLTHTGAPTWLERAWAAVLACRAAPTDDASAEAEAETAALGGESALRAADGPGRRSGVERTIHVVIDRSRRVVPPPDVRVTRTFDLAGRVLWNVGPPRLRYDEAALDGALAGSTEMDVIAALARAVQNRHTTAGRMRDVLDGRRRAPRRDFVRDILDDVARGTCSVLEHGYLDLVERPHGLPPAVRQEPGRASAGVVYRDVSYGEIYVELDGRLCHDSAEDRDRDFERDLDAAVAGQRTVRLAWGQVFDRPCSTAAKVSSLLVARGWPAAVPCGTGCAVARAS